MINDFSNLFKPGTLHRTKVDVNKEFFAVRSTRVSNGTVQVRKKQFNFELKSKEKV